MARALDLTGRQFDYLTVIGRVANDDNGNSRWRCACKCGAALSVNGKDLTSGNTTSCGCRGREMSMARMAMNRNKWIGKRVGNLVVDGEFEKGVDSQRITALCTCDCGNKTRVSLGNLRTKKTKSCGCMKYEGSRGYKRWLRSGENALKKEVINLYRSYVRRAESSGIEFSLTDEDIERLCSSDCHYCGAAPSRVQTYYVNDSGLRWNGIDRVDNNSGYVVSNCVPCCKDCNYGKRKMSKDDFVAMCHAVASRHPLHGTVNSQSAAVLHGPWVDRNIETSPLKWAVQ